MPGDNPKTNKKKKSLADQRAVNFNSFQDSIATVNRGRPINVAHMKQLQDSLLARQIPIPQRIAILATSAQESGKDGAASRGVGGNGLLGFSTARMPLSYLGSSPEAVGLQIKYMLDDIYNPNHPNWLDGGAGDPYVKDGEDGYNQFINAKTIEEAEKATKILNKSYIRPRDRETSWNNRAKVALNMLRFLIPN